MLVVFFEGLLTCRRFALARKLLALRSGVDHIAYADHRSFTASARQLASLFTFGADHDDHDHDPDSDHHHDPESGLTRTHEPRARLGEPTTVGLRHQRDREADAHPRASKSELDSELELETELETETETEAEVLDGEAAGGHMPFELGVDAPLPLALAERVVLTAARECFHSAPRFDQRVANRRARVAKTRYTCWPKPNDREHFFQLSVVCFGFLFGMTACSTLRLPTPFAA